MTATATERSARPRQPVNKVSWGRVFIYLVLSFFCLTTIAAFIWVIMISLKTSTEFVMSSPWDLPEKLNVENYIFAWSTAKIGSYFGNSLFVATAGATLSVAISALPAYAIARIPFGFNKLAGNYFLIGYMIPLMLAVIPLFFMMSGFGMASGVITLLLLYIASGVPFNTFVLRGFFESLPSELEEAAAVDGASPFRVFWQIMLPLAWPGLVSAYLLNFLSLWNEFFLALIFLRKASATLPLGLFYMQQRAYYTAQWPPLFAGVVMATIPVLIIFALLQNQITKGMTAGALKG